MITLVIKEKGHLIDIPGIQQFRTPATIDISKGDIRTIVGYLKVCDINDYEIIASNNEEKEVYRAKDFNVQPPKAIEKKKVEKIKDNSLEKRIDRIEQMIQRLYEKTSNDSGKKVEQTTNQMEQFQRQMLDAIKNIRIGDSKKDLGNTRDDFEDDISPFIPDIDTEGMKIRSQGTHKTIKKEESSDDAVDALSKLLNK